MDCDLAVIGAAGSGMVAAVKAADVGGKKVIVLEKAKKPGGATIFANDMGESGPIIDSRWQKEAGYAVNDPPDITGQFFDWLASKGGAEEFFRIYKSGEEKRVGGNTVAIYMPGRQEKYKDLPDKSIGPGWMGSYVVDKMLECCEQMGIPVLTESRARRFITDHKGRVTGVLADTQDRQLLVNCKACIIAAGGFGANYERLQRYWPEHFNNKEIFCLCPPTITGDCIDMAGEIGAAVDQTKRDVSYPGGFFSTGFARHPYSSNIGGMNGVYINLNGERWMNEGGGQGQGSESLASQPKGVAYEVVDENILDMQGAKITERLMNEDDAAATYKKWKEAIAYEVAIDEEGASGNHIKKADTLAELALKMDVDPKAFVTTIERYNSFCDNGKDTDFGRDASSLIPIRKPPFYAIFGHRWSQCTKGRNGIAVNTRFEVLDTRGETMPGLYAVGDGCTIYGGFLNRVIGGRALALGTAAVAPGASKGLGITGVPDAGPGVEAGAPAAGAGDAPGSGHGAVSGGAPGASAAGTNILSGEGSPCGGLGPAFISGYYAGINAANYLKNI